MRRDTALVSRLHAGGFRCSARAANGTSRAASSRMRIMMLLLLSGSNSRPPSGGSHGVGHLVDLHGAHVDHAGQNARHVVGAVPRFTFGREEQLVALPLVSNQVPRSGRGDIHADTATATIGEIDECECGGVIYPKVCGGWVTPRRIESRCAKCKHLHNTEYL